MITSEKFKFQLLVSESWLVEFILLLLSDLFIIIIRYYGFEKIHEKIGQIRIHAKKIKLMILKNFLKFILW